MKRSDYDKQLIEWVQNHYWDSLEKDKDLILRHFRAFAEDERASQPITAPDAHHCIKHLVDVKGCDVYCPICKTGWRR